MLIYKYTCIYIYNSEGVAIASSNYILYIYNLIFSEMTHVFYVNVVLITIL